MNETLTLRELKAQLQPTIQHYERAPGYRQLEKTEVPISAYDDGKLRMLVYPSGYIAARLGRNRTVFHIDSCGDYQYRVGRKIPGDGTPHEFDAEYFLDKRWEIRVLMEAEDRLERNNDLYEFGNAARY